MHSGTPLLGESLPLLLLLLLLLGGGGVARLAGPAGPGATEPGQGLRLGPRLVQGQGQGPGGGEGEGEGEGAGQVEGLVCAPHLSLPRCT